MNRESFCAILRCSVGRVAPSYTPSFAPRLAQKSCTILGLVFAALFLTASTHAQYVILGKTTYDKLLAAFWAQNQNASNTVQGLNNNHGTNRFVSDLLPAIFTNQYVFGSTDGGSALTVSNQNSVELSSGSGTGALMVKTPGGVGIVLQNTAHSTDPSATYGSGFLMHIDNDDEDPVGTMVLGVAESTVNGVASAVNVAYITPTGIELPLGLKFTGVSYVPGSALSLDANGNVTTDLVDARLKEIVSAEGYEITAPTLDSDGVISTATVLWPEAVPGTGTFTTTVKNSTFLKVDAFTVTHDPTGKTVTQAAVTRNGSGQVTAKPALTVTP